VGVTFLLCFVPGVIRLLISIRNSDLTIAFLPFRERRPGELPGQIKRPSLIFTVR
jgi:hypothetical protein